MARKYDSQALLSLVSKYKIQLLKDYTQRVTRETPVVFKCLTDVCEAIISFKLRSLIGGTKTKTCYCKPCQFLQKAKKKHGDKYDYSETDYKRNTIHVIIKCKLHGRFSKSPTAHLIRGEGCPSCSRNYEPTTAGWIAYAKTIHGADTIIPKSFTLGRMIK